MTARGLAGHSQRPLSVSEYQRIFKNPFYYGHFRYGGELFEGKHDPIITKQLFDQVQTAMTQRAKPKWRPKAERLFQGVFRCGECGAFITTETQKGHNYLRCTKKRRPCSQPYMREEEALRQIRTVIGGVTLPKDVLDCLAATAESRADETAAAQRRDSLELRTRIGHLDAKLERLTIAYLDTIVSADEYRTTKTRILGQKAELKQELRELQANPTYRLEPLREVIRSLNEAVSRRSP